MSTAFWKSDSANVVVSKAVISGSGHVVAKNYDRKTLRDGDLGLELRLDRGKITEMTPEQRAAAQALARDMSQDLLTTLGAEPDDAPFKPGMVICRTDDKGDKRYLLVKKMRSELLEAIELKPDGKQVTCTIPLTRYEVEQVADYMGLDGLILTIADLTGTFGGLTEANRRITPEIAKLVSAENAYRIFSDRTLTNEARLAVETLDYDADYLRGLIKDGEERQIVVKEIYRKTKNQRTKAACLWFYDSLKDNWGYRENVSNLDESVLAEMLAGVFGDTKLGNEFEEFEELVRASLRLIKDQELIKKLAWNSRYHLIQELAALMLENQEDIYFWLCKGEHWVYRWEDAQQREEARSRLEKLFARLNDIHAKRVIDDFEGKSFMMLAWAIRKAPATIEFVRYMLSEFGECSHSDDAPIAELCAAFVQVLDSELNQDDCSKMAKEQQNHRDADFPIFLRQLGNDHKFHELFLCIGYSCDEFNQLSLSLITDPAMLERVANHEDVLPEVRTAARARLAELSTVTPAPDAVPAESAHNNATE